MALNNFITHNHIIICLYKYIATFLIMSVHTLAFWFHLAVFRLSFGSDHSHWAKWSKLGPSDQFWPCLGGASVWSVFDTIACLWPIKFEYKTANKLSTINICLWPFLHDTSFIDICMDFAHKYINICKIIYIYILVYKYI